MITHGQVETIGDGLERLHAVAEHMDVTLLFPRRSARSTAFRPATMTFSQADLVVVLGGDGTMLRTLDRFIDSGVPVFGVNYGRVGFLTSVPGAELESGVERAFAGDYRLLELPTLEVEADGQRRAAINDIVLISSTHGRVVELNWQVGGEDYGTVACDGMVCATAIGSTAYNLSNGGPVLVWGIDVMAITFVAPHTLGRPPARGSARAVAGRPQRDGRHPALGARGRLPARQARLRPARRGHLRREARTAGAAAGSDLRAALPRDLPFLGRVKAFSTPAPRMLLIRLRIGTLKSHIRLAGAEWVGWWVAVKRLKCVPRRCCRYLLGKAELRSGRSLRDGRHRASLPVTRLVPAAVPSAEA